MSAASTMARERLPARPMRAANESAPPRTEREQRRVEAFTAGLVRQVGPRFASATFCTFVAETAAQRKAVAVCTDWARTEAHGAALLLLGRPGTGKTHLAIAAGRAFIERTVCPVHFATQVELVREIRRTWAKGADESTDDVLHRLASESLLIVDDAGAGFGSDAERAQLLDVLDQRYRLRKPTAITTNLPLPQLQDAIGERAVDRLCDGGRVVVFDWASNRRLAQ